jgi:fatty-acyl-CoA synthase
MLDWDIDRKGSVLKRPGLPVPLIQIEVMDASGNKLPHDAKSTGEIVLRAPWLTEGYFKEPERNCGKIVGYTQVILAILMKEDICT